MTELEHVDIKMSKFTYTYADTRMSTDNDYGQITLRPRLGHGNGRCHAHGHGQSAIYKQEDKAGELA